MVYGLESSKNKVISILKTKIPVGIGEFRSVCTR